MGSDRNFPRIKIKEQKCVVNDGAKFIPTGSDEREVLAIILDLSLGGASLKTNISSRLNAAFQLQLPPVGDLEAFTVNSEIVRLEMADDSTPKKPRFLFGLKFIEPDTGRIKKFIEFAAETAEKT